MARLVSNWLGFYKERRHAYCQYFMLLPRDEDCDKWRQITEALCTTRCEAER